MKCPIETARVRPLNEASANAAGSYVLYWMQQSQRAEWNPALEFAVARANVLRRPVVVAFGLMDDYPEANLRHYTFMLEGLRETATQLATRGIPFVLRHGAPAKVALELGKAAAEIICDRGYLRHQKAWRAEVADHARCKIWQVEADVIVPADTVSTKEEFAARTLRPKITRLLPEFLNDCPRVPVQTPAADLSLPPGLDLSDVPALCARLKLDRSVPPVSEFFRGGTGEAKRTFKAFLARKLSSYADHRNRPETEDVSHMSKYLHFGQISPVWLACEARAMTGTSDVNVRTFIEELLVRRELAVNFVHFNPAYDRFEGIPSWARQNLAEHAKDKRPIQYTAAELEAGRTRDPYWNASMKEMLHTGYMHNYMRMYWGKKILEWMATPEEAFRTALALNNKYFLDGRDPNSYAGVAWIFGKHDRPFFKREIFGQIRYMAASGLERKCDIQGYVRRVDHLVRGMQELRTAK